MELLFSQLLHLQKGPVPATFKWGGLTGAGAPEAGLVFQRLHAKWPIIISDAHIAHKKTLAYF